MSTALELNTVYNQSLESHPYPLAASYPSGPAPAIPVSSPYGNYQSNPLPMGPPPIVRPAQNVVDAINNKALITTPSAPITLGQSFNPRSTPSWSDLDSAPMPSFGGPDSMLFTQLPDQKLADAAVSRSIEKNEPLAEAAFEVAAKAAKKQSRKKKEKREASPAPSDSGDSTPDTPKTGRVTNFITPPHFTAPDLAPIAEAAVVLDKSHNPSSKRDKAPKSKSSVDNGFEKTEKAAADKKSKGSDFDSWSTISNLARERQRVLRRDLEASVNFEDLFKRKDSRDQLIKRHNELLAATDTKSVYLRSVIQILLNPLSNVKSANILKEKAIALFY